MGSLLPGWDHSVTASEQQSWREEDSEYTPWWLNKKELIHLKDNEARRHSLDSTRRSSIETSEKRRHSFEHRSSFEFPEKFCAEDQGEVDDGNFQWWKKLMSNYLNEKPDSNVDDYKKGSYQPQFDVAGDCQYSKSVKLPSSFPIEHLDD